jgi:hypothetical protein
MKFIRGLRALRARKEEYIVDTADGTNGLVEASGGWITNVNTRRGKNIIVYTPTVAHTTEHGYGIHPSHSWPIFVG